MYAPLIDVGFRHRTLEEAGWFDFVNGKRPDTKSAVTMACHALSFLCLNGPLMNMRMDCLRAIFTFLRLEGKALPQAAALRQLADLMDEKVVNEDHVHEWFHRHYP